MSATSGALGSPGLTSASTSVVGTPPSNDNGAHKAAVYGADNYEASEEASDDDNDHKTNVSYSTFKVDTSSANNADNNGDDCKSTTGLTTHNSATTTTTIGLMTPTRLTVQLPLLTLLNSPPGPLHHALLAIHLRHNPILLLPNPTGLHLAVNYHSAGTSALDLACTGPAHPFTTTPLPRSLLPHLRKFTLLVPTHAGWLSDGALARRQQLCFLLAAHEQTGETPDAVAHAWFASRVRAEAGWRDAWSKVVAECVLALGMGLVGALRADGLDGEEARGRLEGRVVFQEWCDGWGEGCGADAGLVERVREKVGVLERCYGRVMKGRLQVVVGEGEVGVWGMEGV